VRGVIDAPGGISRFVNKTVSLRFHGRALAFQLSHALFSSYDIDAGSRLLLKSLSMETELGTVHSALDIGCGVGVIGACVASRAQEAEVLMQDRDALAAAFSRENCRENGLDRVEVSCGLAFQHLGGRSFDLVTSNLPAKAGKPVLQSFLRHAAGCLSANGLAAVVIVAPLAQFTRETITGFGGEISHVEESAGYTVFHYRAGAAAEESDVQREDLSPYRRVSASFSAGGFSYSLQTAHSLPDFDTLGYRVQLAFGMLEGMRVSGSVLFWNPGQGHLPAGLASRPGHGMTAVHLASRDSLQCAIAALNLGSTARPPQSSRAVCSESDLEAAYPGGSFDLLVAEPMTVPRVPWHAELSRASAALLRRGGDLLLIGTSTEIHRFLEQKHGLRLVAGRKHMGFRAVLMKKP
jgi:predicted RNA methylase